MAAALSLATACAVGAWLALRGDGFDGDAWRREAGNHAGRNSRVDMVSALDARLPPGTSRAAVRALIGDPDYSDDGQDVYVLGRGAMGPHFESHVIVYDGSGRVAGSRRRRG